MFFEGFTRTEIKTSVGPSWGTGSSCNVSTWGPPYRSIAIARIVAGTRRSVGLAGVPRCAGANFVFCEDVFTRMVFLPPCVG